MIPLQEEQNQLKPNDLRECQDTVVTYLVTPEPENTRTETPGEPVNVEALAALLRGNPAALAALFGELAKRSG